MATNYHNPIVAGKPVNIMQPLVDYVTTLFPGSASGAMTSLPVDSEGIYPGKNPLVRAPRLA